MLEYKGSGDPLGMFHLFVRKKHLRRLIPCEPKGKFSDYCFEVVEDQEDQKQHYYAHYSSLKRVYDLVDRRLLRELLQELKAESMRSIEARHLGNPSFSLEFDLLIGDFKLMMLSLSDLYNRLQSYKLISGENYRNFGGFDVEKKLRSAFAPFVASKLFGKLNALSSRVAQKAVAGFAGKLLRANLGYLELFVPEVELLNSKSKPGKFLQRLLNSSVFEEEHNQMKLILGLFNEKLGKYIDDVEKSLAAFFEGSLPLSEENFDVFYEVINLRIEEINTLKLNDPSTELDFNTLCKIAKVSFSSETPQQLNTSTPQQLNTSTAQHLNPPDQNSLIKVSTTPLEILVPNAPTPQPHPEPEENEGEDKDGPVEDELTMEDFFSNKS